MKFYQYINEDLIEETYDKLYALIKNSPLNDKIEEFVDRGYQKDFLEIEFKKRELNDHINITSNIEIKCKPETISHPYIEYEIKENYYLCKSKYLTPENNLLYMFSLTYTDASEIKNILKKLDEVYNRIPYNRPHLLYYIKIMWKNNPKWMTKTYTILTLEERLELLKDKPEYINFFPNPSRQEIEFITNNKPWILTNDTFDKCSENCEDLKDKWSKIGKARKQIGL